jgi:hypothetical protein
MRDLITCGLSERSDGIFLAVDSDNHEESNDDGETDMKHDGLGLDMVENGGESLGRFAQTMSIERSGRGAASCARAIAPAGMRDCDRVSSSYGFLCSFPTGGRLGRHCIHTLTLFTNT